MGLTDLQLHVIEVTERVASILSLLATSFIIGTFLYDKAFHRPINQLVFYASWGNIMANVGTLISRSGIHLGINRPLCQFQGFMIQMFMPADALWTLAMACNVYLTFFRKYNSHQLRALERRYLIFCYGTPFIPAFVYLFVQTPARGKVYGSATLWCWVATEWDFLRVATFYAPIWVVIAFTFSIYLWAGKEIFAKRRQLRNFDHAASDVTFPVIQNPFISPFVSVRTTEISVTTELPSRNRSYPKFALDESGCIISDTGFDAYSVVIGAGTKQDRTLAHSPALQRSSEFVGLKTDINVKHMQAAMQANEAAFSYCKCALLFFASLLVTWVPSSINRVYTLVYPHAYPFPLLFVAALVLPLQGLWNGLIYTATSLPECRALCSQLMEYWAPRKNKSLRPYPPIISQESLGSSRDIREGVPTGIREVV